MSNFCASPVHSAFLVPQTAARPAMTCITDRVKTEIMYFRKRPKVVPVFKIELCATFCLVQIWKTLQHIPLVTYL